MTYAIKEIFYTLQGEGAQAGRPAVFCRFSGCNLWSGNEAHRAKAICQFCDTDFVGTDGENGGKYTNAISVVEKISQLWPKNQQHRFVVCTGGEPLLQLDTPLIQALHQAHFEIAIETNGTLQPPADIDWICVSPKANAELVLKKGNELKVVVPQDNQPLMEYTQLDFEYFYLQPMDGPQREAHTQWAIEYCRQHPQWRLSLQTHKILNIP